LKIIRYLDALGVTHHAAEQANGKPLRIQGDIFGDFEITAEIADVQKLLAPIEPCAILCIGLNYRRHATEMNAPLPTHPVLFMKQPAALQHPGTPIEIPTHLASECVDYEAELAVVIGKRCKNVPPENALDHVYGYTCANDVSARDWQKERSGGQWCRGKTFDTFAPLGPRIVTTDEIPDPSALRLRALVNGEVLQDSPTSDMIFGIPTLVSFLSGSTTLLPGTVILTGTPSGVGMGRTPPRWLQPGDVVTVDIDGIGALTNPVVLEKEKGRP
jgi:2-keto-4-pentenoate hydratase/2-oxohepta-3-ene-1,7-dioic acid hydratase in catechol pathway